MSRSLGQALLGPKRLRSSEPVEFPQMPDLRVWAEVAYLRRLLKESHGNVAAAARAANRPRTTFRGLLRKFDINPHDYRR